MCEERNTSTQPGPMQVLSLGLFSGLLILRQVKIISKGENCSVDCTASHPQFHMLKLKLSVHGVWKQDL